MKMELNEAIDKLNKAGLITEFLGFGKRKITDDETKLKAIEELFEDDSVKRTGPGKFEAKNMEQYDVITYYDWDENDTMTVSFNFMKKGVRLEHFSEHLRKTIYNGDFCPDSTMAEFIEEVGELYQECFGV